MDKRQERGFLVLVFIAMLVIVFNRYGPGIFIESQEYLAQTAVHIKKLPVEAENNKNDFATKNKPKEIPLDIKQSIDPNQISLEELKAINLPSYVANNWIKYRNSGAEFKKADDVSKIYGLSESHFKELKHWLYFPKQENKKTNEITNKKPEDKILKEKIDKSEEIPKIETIKMGINTADSLELLKVNGIGPFYAAAMVKYREKLGGYRNINQLMELYKMDSAKLLKMLPQLYLDTIVIDKINLNTATFKEILRHPYIDYETTKYIVNKRNKLGKYAAIYQLKDSAQMPDELYHKILPYIKLVD